MELSILLTKQIVAMFLMLIVGFVLVRIKMVQEKEARTLSTVMLYVVFPCVMITSFQREIDPEMLQGLAIGLVAGIVINGVFILIGRILRGALGLSNVEEMSLVYTNAGNLIVPLVAAVLGSEWVVFSCTFVIVQTFLLFTHCQTVIQRERNINIKKLLLGPNIVAMFIGAALCFLQITIPVPIMTAMNGFAAMVSPLAMLIIGISVGQSNLKRMFSNIRLYGLVFIRLIVMPLIIILLIKVSCVCSLIPIAHDVLLISLLAAGSSCAATVVQQAQYYKQDAVTASQMNTLSVLFLIVTLPFMVMIYQWLV